MDEQVMSTDASGRPAVVRVGGTIRRLQGPGSELAASLLVHLDGAGFLGAPRFLGIDEAGRQVVSFVEGDVQAAPDWQHGDNENARHLGAIARLIREMHAATEGFRPPDGAEPFRPLPLVGPTWTHGDIGYQNVVYRDGQPFAFIDWEFCAPANKTHDLAGLLALCVRAPRPDVDDNERRAAAVDLALEHIVNGHDLDAESADRLFADAAVVLDDAATFWEETGQAPDNIAPARWRANWFRTRTTT